MSPEAMNLLVWTSTALNIGMCLYAAHQAKEIKHDPAHTAAELLDLVVKSARRCAYDLRHCSEDLDRAGRTEDAAMYRQRSYHFLQVFAPGDGPKNYQVKLHQRIEELEGQLDEIFEALKDRDIDLGFDRRDIPF